MKSALHLDLETLGDLDLNRVGVARYTSHHSFQILLWAWSREDGPVEQSEDEPDIDWDEIILHAYNAPFELACLRAVGFEIPLENVRCTMAHAYSRGFSGTLADVGAQLGLPKDKAKLASGTRLITRFCCPTKAGYVGREHDPKGWEEFREYNRQDVVAEREVLRRLNAWPWTEDDQRRWMLSERINRLGLPVDEALAWAAVEYVSTEEEEAGRRMEEMTGGLRPSQTGQLLEWCRARGYPFDNLRADTIRAYLGVEE